MGTIIGLTGMKQAGKDTVANLLVKVRGEDGQTLIRVAFADKVKECLVALDPYVRRDLTGMYERLSTALVDTPMEELKQEPDVRRLLQRLGTEMGREILGQDVWVEAIIPTVANELYRGHEIAISDVRFKSEIDFIKSERGMIWEIRRPNLTDDDTHISEHEWRQHKADIVIVNNGTIEQLETAVAFAWDGMSNPNWWVGTPGQPDRAFGQHLVYAGEAELLKQGEWINEHR